MQVRSLPEPFMPTTKQIKKIRDELSGKNVAPVKAPSPADLLGTGSTLLNLACSGHPRGGFAKGGYYFFVGDSSSGKTFFSLTCLAEAAASKRFDGYRFIYDGPEGGARMDLAKFFGSKVAARLEAPRVEDDKPQASKDIEDFYFNIDDAFKAGRPFIYILDSMDSLSSAQEREKADARKAFARGRTKKKPAGEYGDGKAKVNSSGIRRGLADLRDSGSILLILNQTRDNIGGGPFDPKKTRSGGHSLTFYADLEMWSKVGGSLKRTVRGKERQIGIIVKVRVKKNRQTGRDRTISVPIYWSTGIDDLGGCVDFLVDERAWTKNKAGVIDAVGLGLDGTREEIVEQIEERGLERDLRMLTADLWREIDEATAVKRKPRYE